MSNHPYDHGSPGESIQSALDHRALEQGSRVSTAEDTGLIGDLNDNQGDDSSSICSESSIASTIEFEHEPYDTYQHRVTQLMLDYLPTRAIDDVQVQRMKGGSYNRIIGVSVPRPQSKLPWYALLGLHKALPSCPLPSTKPAVKSQEYIVRIPRGPVYSLIRDATTLEYVARKVPYPTPNVLAYDSSNDNVLGQPYMLQERFDGQPLSDLWDSLNHDQKKHISRDVAKMVLQLSTITNRCPGVISTRNSNHDLNTDLKVEPIPIPRSSPDSPTIHDVLFPQIVEQQTTRDFLTSLCDRQQASAAQRNKPSFPKIWAGFKQMIQKLHELGRIPDTDCFSLYHGDLYPRNILCKVVDERGVTITGIIDWDLACFAPKFMSTRAPFFLWTEADSDEENDRDALVMPEAAEEAEYKQIFEEAVGKGFLEHAYDRDLVLARLMFHTLVRGVNSGGEVFVAEEILKDFWAAHPGT